MQNFIIKTHQKDTIYSKPHLFLLNKGLNSGKPQKEPFSAFRGALSKCVLGV